VAVAAAAANHKILELSTHTEAAAERWIFRVCDRRRKIMRVARVAGRVTLFVAAIADTRTI
jgi:hypothetical protein